MKFKVTYIRTLTLEQEIEADTLGQAEGRAEEIQTSLANADYPDAYLEREVEPKFEQECQDCHEAEGLNEDLPWCWYCLMQSHHGEWDLFKVETNTRFQTQKTFCHQCFKQAFGCVVRENLSETSFVVLCPVCLEKESLHGASRGEGQPTESDET
jgi:hypothetical protein